MKGICIGIALLFFTAANYVRAVNDKHGGIVGDGEYAGLERMTNLTPEERDTAWFHENTLLIRNDEAILDKIPISIHHGKKEYSASDGGFLTYRARLITKDGQSFVELRLFQSDYIIFRSRKDRQDEYTKIRTYPVSLAAGRIEFDRVTYRPAKLHRIDLDRLLRLLTTEPLEKGNGATDEFR